MKKVLLFAGILSLILTTAEAGPTSPFVPGIRPLGMGGTFMAIADDTNAMFYNPAGLSRVDETYISFLDMRFETSQDTIDLGKYFWDNQDRLQGKGAYTTDNPMSNLTTEDINKLTSVHVKFRYDLDVLSMAWRNFAMGVYGNLNLDVSIKQQGLFDMRVGAVAESDLLVPISYAHEINIQGLNDFFDDCLAGGRLSLGGTVKVFQRRSINENLSLFEIDGFTKVDPLTGKSRLDNDVDNFVKGTMGYGFDLGTLYHVNQLYSNFAIVVRDLYTSIGDETVKPDLGFGYAYRPPWTFGPFKNFIFAFDLDGINDSTLTFFNKWHMGFETTFIGIFGLRVGAYQGYPSLGVSLFGRAIQYANYSVEKGDYPGQIEERRHTLSFGFNF